MTFWMHDEDGKVIKPIEADSDTSAEKESDSVGQLLVVSGSDLTSTDVMSRLDRLEEKIDYILKLVHRGQIR